MKNCRRNVLTNWSNLCNLQTAITCAVVLKATTPFHDGEDEGNPLFTFPHYVNRRASQLPTHISITHEQMPISHQIFFLLSFLISLSFTGNQVLSPFLLENFWLHRRESNAEHSLFVGFYKTWVDK